MVTVHHCDLRKPEQTAGADSSSKANQVDKGCHIGQVDDTITVDIRFGLKSAIGDHVDKSRHVKQIDGTVQIDVAQQDLRQVNRPASVGCKTGTAPASNPLTIRGDCRDESRADFEDAFWNQLRINPDQIPKGERMVLPGSHYFRFSHRELTPYQAVITVEKAPRKNYPNTKSFSVNYPELDRLLTIFYQADFPHQIIAWEERRASGFGDSAKRMTTTATLKSDVKTSYWSQNKTEDASWRDSLKLNH